MGFFIKTQQHEKGSILTTAKILLPQDSEVAALTMVDGL